MKLSLPTSIAFISLLTSISKSSPLTLDLFPGTEQCLYIEVPIKECLIKYYFNIQDWAYDDEFLDYSIYYLPSDTLPDNQRILKPKSDGENERQVRLMTKTDQRIGEWQFTADEKGEYKICFISRKHKILDFDITANCTTSSYHDIDKDMSEYVIDPLVDDSVVSLKQINDLAVDDKLRSLIENLEHQVSSLRSNLDYYRVRNARNLKTVESTLSRINWFSFGSLLIITLVCFVQVTLVKYLFTRNMNRQGKYQKRF